MNVLVLKWYDFINLLCYVLGIGIKLYYTILNFILYHKIRNDWVLFILL